jgi:hypothetical protein
VKSPEGFWKARSRRRPAQRTGCWVYSLRVVSAGSGSVTAAGPERWESVFWDHLERSGQELGPSQVLVK